MNIKEKLLNEFNQIDDVKERNRFISEIFDFLVIANKMRDEKVDEMFSMAEESINEEKDNIRKEAKKTLNDIKRKTQPVRDSINSISKTAKLLGDQIERKSDKNNVIITLNNIFEFLEIVSKTLTELNLWSGDEEKPEIVKFENTPKKTTKKAKRDKTQEDIKKNVAQQTFGLQGDNNEE